MAYEMPYPCRSTEPHGPHQHTAQVWTSTDGCGQPIYRDEPGMWCAGFTEPPAGAEPIPGVVRFPGSTLTTSQTFAVGF